MLRDKLRLSFCLQKEKQLFYCKKTCFGILNHVLQLMPLSFLLFHLVFTISDDVKDSETPTGGAVGVCSHGTHLHQQVNHHQRCEILLSTCSHSKTVLLMYIEAEKGFSTGCLTMLCLPLAVGACGSCQPAPAWISPGGQSAEHAASSTLEHKQTHLLHGTLNLQAYFPLICISLTYIDTMRTSAQADAQYNTQGGKCSTTLFHSEDGKYHKAGEFKFNTMVFICVLSSCCDR